MGKADTLHPASTLASAQKRSGNMPPSCCAATVGEEAAAFASTSWRQKSKKMRVCIVVTNHG